MKNYYCAAADIGGTKVTVSIADSSGILIKLYQRVHLSGSNTAVPEQVVNLIKIACEKTSIPFEHVQTVGVGTASPFVIQDGFKAIAAPNLCGGLAREREAVPNDWREIPIEKVMSAHFERIEIDNDCVTAVIAEHLFGAGAGEDNLIYVTWSTGIGAGLIVDGRVLRGKNGNAGHGGHIYIAEEGPQCGCGNFGDMEVLTSGVAIARMYGGGISTKEVFSAYRKGDARAREVIERAARHFARGLASMNALLDTRLIIIGGSVFLNDYDILQPLVESEFYRSFPALSSGVQIKPSALHSYLGDIAALSLVMPDEWKEHWKRERPWEKAPETVVIE